MIGMTFDLRTSLRRLLIPFVILVSTLLPASAQSTYPDHAIRFVVGFGQGGPTDVVARVLADELSGILGQGVYVNNTPGASGNIATQTVAHAPADGYTFLIGASPLAVNHWLFPDFPIRFGRDIEAVAPIGATTNALVVHPDLKIRTLGEFIDRVREKHGALTYATLGPGSSSHLAGLAFELAAGSKMTPVPYKGSAEALVDLLGQHVDAWFATIPSVLPQIRAGQLTALATTGPERTIWLKDTPTIAESGFQKFDVRLWVGVFAPAGVPAERVARVEQAIQRAIASERMRQTLELQGISPLDSGRAAFSQFVSDEIARWKDVVEAMKKAPAN